MTHTVRAGHAEKLMLSTPPLPALLVCCLSALRSACVRLLRVCWAGVSFVRGAAWRLRGWRE